MLQALKSLLEDRPAQDLPGHERKHLQAAVASLLHEATRVDLAQAADERAAAEHALTDLFSLPAAESANLLVEGGDRAKHLTSYFALVSVIKHDLSLEQRVRLIEHLWRVAYADGRLDPYEDHYVRKIAHLLYVPNTQSMLARNRARSA
ncbi:MAG: TerB family tellurite resistance protein [Burkholderiales bacterium]